MRAWRPFKSRRIHDSINAGGAFYRVQNSLNENSENVSKSMQRLLVASKILLLVTALRQLLWLWPEGELPSKVGLQNATEVLQAMEMANNDLEYSE